MNKHTPGPWSISGSASGKGVIESEFGMVALVFGFDDPDDETLPNARLIAAAPDLLRELRALIACAAESYDENGGEELIAGIALARAATKTAVK